MFYVFIKFNWYQEHYLKNMFMFIFGIKSFIWCFTFYNGIISFVLPLVSKACFENLFVLFNWYQEHVCVLCMIDAYVFMNIHCIYLMFIDAWVKGELLWSLTLIQAYITPWVLSSSKSGRLLAQRPSTLVLMMINSRSYVY